MEQKYSISNLLARIKTNWPEMATVETELVFGLIRLNDIVGDRAERIVAQHHLTDAAFEVLATLRSLAPPRELSPSDLSKSILITSGGMTKVLKQLEADGLVERTSHATDKRSKMVRLTDLGTRKAQEVMHDVAHGDRALLSSSMSEDEVVQLRDILLHALHKLERD